MVFFWNRNGFRATLTLFYLFHHWIGRYSDVYTTGLLVINATFPVFLSYLYKLKVSIHVYL